MQASEQQSQELWRELLGKLAAKEAECQELSAASRLVSHSGNLAVRLQPEHRQSQRQTGTAQGFQWPCVCVCVCQQGLPVVMTVYRLVPLTAW